MNNERVHSSWTRFALLLLVAAFSEGSSSSFSPQRVRDWIQTRCGEGSAVWVYEGALYDPLDGHKIANVEGLELVRYVGDSETPSRCSSLKAHQLEGDYSATVLSRRLFCYQSPQQPQRLLDSIRLRPNAPRRRVPMNQAVALYDTATTYVSHKNQLIVHTEWPKGNCIWAKAISPREVSSKSLDFSILARPTLKDLPDLSDESNGDDEVVIAPKRSQLVQFGASSQKAHNNRFGARETYSYTMEDSPSWLARSPSWLARFWGVKNDVPRLRYTRYGEGPPWYGPGKYCMLELQGRRVNSLSEAPPLATSVAAQRVPGFLSVDGPITSDASVQRAVEWFHHGNLQLEDDQLEQVPDGGLRRLAYQVGKGGSALFERIRAASTLNPS